MANDSSYDSVLIIGNGFDRNCGLKTSYSDVYQEYTKTPSSTPVIEQFKKDISDNFTNWSDFELGMAVYASRLTSEDDFIECVTDFDYFMHEYLKQVQQRFFSEVKKLKSTQNLIMEFSNSITKLGYGVSHNYDNLLSNMNIPNLHRMGFITLNYTQVFDRLLSRYNDYLSHPIHVHGILGDDPILGMDRETQLNLKFPISDNLKRSFIKPFFNEEYDSGRVKAATQMIESSRVIFVYGASLGESDLSWRELLGKWLLQDKEHHLFFYDYLNSEKVFKTAPEKLNYEIVAKKSSLRNGN